MKSPFAPDWRLVLTFLGVIASVPLVQLAVETRRGEWPQVLEIFKQRPSAQRLRRFEKDLEEASTVAARLRPWAQYAQFTVLRDGGEKALVGRDGWLFYKPGLDYMLDRPERLPGASGANDPIRAVRAFRDDLAARGIQLLVVVTPNKESVYPERLTRRARPTRGMVCSTTQEVLARLAAADIQVLDLFRVFAEAKTSAGSADRPPLYLVQDSHWSPAGVQTAARATARLLLERGWVKPRGVEYETRLIPVRRLGDLLRMLQAPPLERHVEPEPVSCLQVIRRDNGQPYQDDPASELLVLGDSFLRIYQQDEPGAAGFIAHLARELQQPVSSIVNDGGASTLVRQELNRRPALLRNKKVLIWEFVERDIGLGAEGWQTVPLPARVLPTTPARSGRGVDESQFFAAE